MKLSFKLTPDELTFLSMEANLRSPHYKKVLVKSRIALSIGFLLMIFGFGLSEEDKVLSMTILVVGTLFVIFYPKFIRHIWRKNFEKYYREPSSKRFLELQTWTFDSKKLTVNQDKVKSEFQWTAFHMIHEHPHYYLLMLESQQGLLLPKSALKSKKAETEAKSFFKKIPKQ